MPSLAQRYVDHENTHWQVDDVMNSPLLDGFYLVRLRHGKTRECNEGTVVLAPREYKALLKTRKLVRVHDDHPAA
jgi:hypothetical protein